MPRLRILFLHNPKGKPGKWYIDVFNIHDRGVYYCKKGFLRARVINLGASTIRNCEAKVLVQEKGRPTPVDPQILHWSRNIPGTFAHDLCEAFSPWI